MRIYLIMKALLLATFMTKNCKETRLSPQKGWILRSLDFFDPVLKSFALNFVSYLGWFINYMKIGHQICAHRDMSLLFLRSNHENKVSLWLLPGQHFI